MEEIWKEYQPDLSKTKYKVSNFGRVISVATGKEVGHYKNAGYRCVPYTTTERKKSRKKPKLGKRGKPLKSEFKTSMFYVHKVVAELFLKKYEDCPYLGFKDMDRSNCHVNNLVFMNREENYEYMMKTYVCPYDVHEDLVSNKGKLSDSDVRLIRRLKNNSPTKLARKFGVSYRTIWGIQTNRTYKRVK